MVLRQYSLAGVTCMQSASLRYIFQFRTRNVVESWIASNECASKAHLSEYGWFKLELASMCVFVCARVCVCGRVGVYLRVCARACVCGVCMCGCMYK